ncbi:MAG: hypothetical protein ABIR32_16675 [Ilumatobacteraceae bacterium]
MNQSDHAAEPAEPAKPANPVGEGEPAEPEDRIVLRASALRWVWVLIGSMVFVALGAGIALGAKTGIVAQVIGGTIAVVFGFCAVVGVRQMLQPGSLAVGRSSIDMIRRGRLTTYEFVDCGRFTVWRNSSRGSSFVVFDYTPDGDTELHRANRQMMGGTRLFTDNYGISADDLATMLNDVRNRFFRDSRPG